MRKSWVITMYVVVGIAILSAVLVFFYTGDSRRVAKQTSYILQVDKAGTLSTQGEAAKTTLIKPLVGQSGTLLINQSMEIGYLTPPGESIMVFILGDNVEAVEQQALDWLMSRGFSQEDICNFPVIFSVMNEKAQTTELYKLETSYIPPYCQALFD